MVKPFLHMNKRQFEEQTPMMLDANHLHLNLANIGIGKATINLLKRNEKIDSETLIAELNTLLANNPSERQKVYFDAALKYLLT